MTHGSTSSRPTRLWALALLFAATTGCELDSFFNPSVLGRWERTPVVLPVLDQLDIIDEPSTDPPGLSQITPADLEPRFEQYRIGSGDVVSISVFELLAVNQEFQTARRVDELGNVRMPIVGTIHAVGLTEPDLEERIADIIERKGFLKDPTVTIIVQQRTQDTYSIMGEPRVSGTLIGTFSILHADFRLLDALALARGADGRIKKMYVIREVKPKKGSAAKTTDHPPSDLPNDGEVMVDPSKLLERSLHGAPGNSGSEMPGSESSPPMEPSIDQGERQGEWVHVDNKWMRVESTVTGHDDQGADGVNGGPVLTQRVIEIPYDKLQDGDMQYNIVIRPGDIIRVPSPVIGNVFIMGAINRPGTFGLPGEKDLTLKRLIAAAGGLNQLAHPERVDLVRTVGGNQQATVRLNLRAIFDDTQPDFYLKPNDLINVGQSFVTTPVAVARNGFRMTYGFGFILDRNFGVDVFRALNAKLR